jgi:hypothetical protein
MRETVQVVEYKGGRAVRTTQYSGDVSAAHRLRTWINANNEHEWRSSWVSYAPQLLIKVDGTTFNLTGERVILNYDERGKPKQTERKMAPEDQQLRMELLRE